MVERIRFNKNETKPPTSSIFFFFLISFQSQGQHNSIAQIERSLIKIVTRFGTCNGVLLNNTSKDGRQLVLSSRHCFLDLPADIKFIFNNDLLINDQGIRKLSWETRNYSILSESKDLDFVLFELNELIPPYIIPYYAGWNASNNFTYSSIGIHTIKDSIVFTLDINQPKYTTLNVVQDFGGIPIENSLLHIESWEEGYTQIGASGSPIFDQHSLVRGTLTAGQSKKDAPYNDYYMRFNFMYNYFSDPEKSLIDHLNNSSSNVYSLEGLDFPFQKFIGSKLKNRDNDIVSASSIIQYFSVKKSLILHGIFLPIKSVAPNDLLTIEIIESEKIIFQKGLLGIDLMNNTENFLEIPSKIEVNSNFHLKVSSNKNVDYIRSEVDGINISIEGATVNGFSLNIDLLVEGKDESILLSHSDQTDIKIYPNPILDNLLIEGIDNINEISFYSFSGKKVFPDYTLDYSNTHIFNFNNLAKGLYFVIYGNFKKKIMYK